MRKIHFNNNFICICTSKSHSHEDPNAILYFAKSEFETFSDIVSTMQDPLNYSNIYILTKNQELTYSKLLENFTEIEAGGGLVQNSDGDFLIIKRHGKWDLPKGKLEIGEAIESCAVREVEEECGISGVEIVDKICVTDHVYSIDSESIIKHSHWYYMTYSGSEALKAQIEEGISELYWVKKDSLLNNIKTSYPSIQEVVSKLKKD